MKYCSMKEINELVRQQLKKNWSFSRKGKHGRLMPPGGAPFVVVPSTPSDRRAFLNFRQAIRSLESGLYRTQPAHSR
jgi:hypothetical protein